MNPIVNYGVALAVVLLGWFQAFWSLKITHRGRFLSHEATFNSTPKETVLRTLYAL